MYLKERLDTCPINEMYVKDWGVTITTRKLPNKTCDGPCHTRITRVRRLARCWVAPPPTQIPAPSVYYGAMRQRIRVGAATWRIRRPKSTLEILWTKSCASDRCRLPNGGLERARSLFPSGIDTSGSNQNWIPKWRVECDSAGLGASGS
jgi:hypothetical protein